MDAGNGTPILWKCLTTEPSFGPTDDCLCIYLRPSSLTAIIRCWCFWNKICVALAGSSLCKSDWLQTQRLLATASQVLVLKDIHHHDSLQLDVLYSAFSFLNKKNFQKFFLIIKNLSEGLPVSVPMCIVCEMPMKARQGLWIPWKLSLVSCELPCGS